MVNRDRGPDPIGMADVIATRMLGERSDVPLKPDGVLAAVAALADCLATDPERLPQQLVDTARDLTGAASAGLSLEETADGEEIFRWIATSGEFARYVNGTMPRHFSPCGTVVDADEAMLMQQPVRCYPAIASLHVPIQEALLVPFHVGGRPVGTVWVISHTDDRRFNAQDLAVVQALSSVAAAGVQTMRTIDALNNARQQQEGRLVESLAAASTQQQWFDHAPGFVALVRGPAHVFEMVNPAYYQLVGHRSIIGKPAFDALPDVRDQGFEELLDKVYRTGEPFTGYGLPVSLQRVPGAPAVQAYFDLSYHPVRGADGAVAGVFVQGHDVTDQHLALRRLEDADRQKDEFVATLAHELRNPLAPIRQAVRIAQSSNATESQKRWSLEVIERQVNTMALLLDDLLDVARVARGATGRAKGSGLHRLGAGGGSRNGAPGHRSEAPQL